MTGVCQYPSCESSLTTVPKSLPFWDGVFWGGLDFFFGSSVSIRLWMCVRYCRSVMAQQYFSTGPGSWRRAARNESTVALDRTAKGSLFQSEMVQGKKGVLIRISTRGESSKGITIRISRGMGRTAECMDRNCSQTMNAFVEQMQTSVFLALSLL